MNIDVGRQLTEIYRNSHGAEPQKSDRRGYTLVKVLPHLVGRPCDDVAMSYIQGLRPSFVRIVTGVMTCDSFTWRVTVHVDAENVIRDIEQEVEIGLPEPFGCAYEMDQYLRTGEHHPLPEGGIAIVNTRAVRMLEFKDKP